MKDQISKLENMNACHDAMRWVATQTDPKEAWETCERGDWMLWLLGKLSKDQESRKTLVLAACGCARLALKHVPKNEKRPLIAIETAEKWANGKATIAEVKKAAYAAAAYDAAYAAAHATAAAYAAAHAAAAAYDAAYVAYAAYDAAYDAAYAAAYDAAYDAAYAAAYAAAAAHAAAAYAAYDAAYAAAYAVRKETLKQCANIVRKFYPKPPKL